MTVGSIVTHHNCYYVVVHQNGTLEKLSKPRWFRILWVDDPPKIAGRYTCTLL